MSSIYGGAQRVIVDTYEALSVRGFDVTLVSVVPPHRKGRGRAYKFSFRYIEVVECPLASPFIYMLRGLTYLHQGLGLPSQLLFMSYVLSVCGELGSLVNGSDVVVVEEPYVAGLIDPSKRVVRVHNVEFEYIRNALSGVRVVTDVFSRRELEMLSKSKRVIAMSYRDYYIFRKLLGLFDLGPEVFYVEPILLVRGRNLGLEYLHKRGLEEKKYVVFVGSSHLTNVYSARALIRSAPRLKRLGVKIVVGGGVSQYFRGKMLPENVVVTGYLGFDELRTLYSHALAAYVPHPHKSGVPIKLVEAILHNVIPLVSRSVLEPIPLVKGLRDGVNVVMMQRYDDADEMYAIIEKLVKDDKYYEELLRGVTSLSRRFEPSRLVEKYVASLFSKTGAEA